VTDEPLSVLGWGTYDRERHPRVGILLDGLAANGASVVEVNRPDTSGTEDRVGFVRHPWSAIRHVFRLLRVWRRLVRDGRRVLRSRRVDAILVGYLGHLDVVVARLAFRRRVIVLDHLVFAEDTARDRGAGGGVTRWVLRRLDRIALRSSTIALLDTAAQLELAPERLRRRCFVVPVGASEAWFSAGRERERAAGASPGSLRVVFFGLFTPLQGAVTIARALAILARREVPVEATLVGGGQDAESARAALGAATPTWLDWVGIAELPALVASHDVCLGVFGVGPKTGRVVPNKVFQGAAAGCAIVTADTPAQRDLLGDVAAYVPAGSPEALADELERLARDRRAVARLGERAREWATGYAPAAIAAPLLERIREVAR
jgi:glycosyltransferase involved in cell wall biosynthesis